MQNNLLLCPLLLLLRLHLARRRRCLLLLMAVVAQAQATHHVRDWSRRGIFHRDGHRAHFSVRRYADVLVQSRYQRLDLREGGQRQVTGLLRIETRLLVGCGGGAKGVHLRFMVIK